MQFALDYTDLVHLLGKTSISKPMKNSEWLKVCAWFVNIAVEKVETLDVTVRKKGA